MVARSKRKVDPAADQPSMAGRDLYIRRLKADGTSVVTHRRVWDAEKFFDCELKAAQAEDLEIIPQLQGRVREGAPPVNTHVMCDLETLGKGPGCRILSIGAVVMAPGEVQVEPAQFYVELDLNLQPGLHVDPETWAWWQDQPAEVRDRLFDNTSKMSLVTGLKEFGLWLGTVAPRDARGNLELCLWGNGADFDNAILQYAYRVVGLPQPWAFWSNRCYRTLKSLAPSIKLVRTGSLHNALDDARSQADHAVRIVRLLGLDWHAL